MLNECILHSLRNTTINIAEVHTFRVLIDSNPVNVPNGVNENKINSRDVKTY